MEIIAEGAEAQIFKINEKVLKKVRIEKNYRISEIDIKLRKFRTRREFKILKKLYESKVNVPKPIEIFEKEYSFTMVNLDGKVLKKTLNKKKLFNIFEEIIKMHNLDICHGDLTTLNMIDLKEKIYLIDFGLSDFSKKNENKAVDLNLFFTCIKNEHPDFFDFKSKLIAKYLLNAINGEETVKRLEKIEHRGRNK